MAIQLNEVKVQKDVAEDISYTAWTLKNHDWSYIKSKLEQAESIDPANASYKSIYSKVVNKEYSSITEEDYETLRQVLKYKKGFYEKGDEIAEIPGGGNGEFQLLDPGYYLIEVSAPGGKNPTVNMETYLTNNTAWKTNDGKLVLKFGKANSTDRMRWSLSENGSVIAGGKYEINEQAVFLYKANNILSERKTYNDLINGIRSRDDTSDKSAGYIDYYNDPSRDEKHHIYRENISMLSNGDLIYSSDERIYTYLKDNFDADTIYSCSKYSHNDIYDFFEHNLNVFEDKKKFCKIIFSIKGYEFYASDDRVYSSFTVVSGMHSSLNADAISNGDTGNTADRQTFKSLVDAGSFKEFEVKKLFIDAAYCNVYNNLIATKTEGAYCTDGGHIYLIANIDAAVCNSKFTYKMDNGASQVELSNPNFMTIKAGFGGLSKREHKAYKTNIKKGQLDLGFGEKTFAEDNTQNIDGEVKIEIDGAASRLSISGGGGKGAGMRRNDYGTLYWQDAEPGYIKIKYLGDASLECSTMKVSLNKDGGSNDLQLHTLTAEKTGTSFTVSSNGSIKVPNNTDIPIEIDANSYTGNLLPNGSINEKSQLLSLRKVTKSYYKNGSIYRDYYEDLSTKADISYTFYENGDYLGVEDNADGYTVESIDDGFHKGNNAATDIAEIKFEMQNYDFNLNLMNLYNNVTVEDNETFDALKKTTTLQNKGSTKQNIYIHNTLDQVFQLSLDYSNTLDLEALYEFNDNSKTTLRRRDDVGIAYSQMQFSKYTRKPADDESVYYKEKTKVKVSGGQKVFITFFFDSQRLRIDETMSNFPNNTIFYPILYVPETSSPKQLNFDVSEDDSGNWAGSSALGNKGGSRSFQVVEMTMPFASLSITAYVKKNAYKVNILNDLYLNIVPTVLSQKEEFEYGESIAIRFFLPKSMKVSNLKCLNESIESQKQDIMYIQNNIKNIEPESFFSIGDAYQRISSFDGEKDRAELKCCKEEIKNLTEKSFFIDTLDYSLYCARNTVSSANVSDGNGLFKLRNLYKNFNPNVVKSLSDDYPIIVVHMSQNSLSLRLTSDYLLFSEIACIENGSSLGLSIFKRAHFLLMASAGRTGNGGNGVSGETDSNSGHNGGNGGDGYVGGNGGNGTGVNKWSPYTHFWNGAVLNDIGLNSATAGGGGLCGRGFLSYGAIGSAGGTLIGRFHFRNISENGVNVLGLGAVPVYIGCHYLGVVTLQKNEDVKTINQHVNAVLSIKAGVAGQNGLDGLKQKGKLGGYGGAPGTPSYVRIINNKFYQFRFGVNFLSGKKFYGGIESWGPIVNSPNSTKSGLFLGPGVRGNSSCNEYGYYQLMTAFTIRGNGQSLSQCPTMNATSLTSSLNYSNYRPFFSPIRERPTTHFSTDMLSAGALDNFSMNGVFLQKKGLSYYGEEHKYCLKWSDNEETLTFENKDIGLSEMYSIFNVSDCIKNYYSCDSLRNNLINAKIKAISQMSYESGIVIMLNLGDVEDSCCNHQNNISPSSIDGFTTDYGWYDTITENDVERYANDNVENISTIFNYWR